MAPWTTTDGNGRRWITSRPPIAVESGRSGRIMITCQSRLQSAQNASALLVFKIHRHDHVHLLRMTERIIVKITFVTYRSLKGSAPRYLLLHPCRWFTSSAEAQVDLFQQFDNTDLSSYSRQTANEHFRQSPVPTFATNCHLTSPQHHRCLSSDAVCRLFCSLVIPELIIWLWHLLLTLDSFLHLGLLLWF